MLISDQIPLQYLTIKSGLQTKTGHNLQPGQIVRATVISQGDADTIKLRLGSQEVTAHTKLKFNTGRQLTLQVHKGGDIPQLRVLNAPKNSEVQTKILRQILPIQIPQAKLFSTLQNLIKTTPELTQKSLHSPTQTAPTINTILSPTLQNAIQNILKHALPQGNGIAASQIRQALNNSGLLLEAGLTSGNPIQPIGDYKVSLLQLVLLLRTRLQLRSTASKNSKAHSAGTTAPSPANTDITQLLAKLLQQTEGGLARIQIHQLSSLPTEDNSRQVWQFELPVKQQDHVNSFLIRLEQENSDSEKKEGNAWKITLNFDFSPLGPVQVNLILQNEGISAVFQAEDQATAMLLKQHLPKLNNAFIQLGLEVNRLQSHQGKVVPPIALPISPLPLLDEKA